MPRLPARRPLLRLVLALAVLLPAAIPPDAHSAPPRADDLPPHEAVRFPTDDELELVATRWSLDAESDQAELPVVVALPGFGHARIAYLPLVRPLTERGLELLAVDPRGHGDSSVQGDRHLSRFVVERDPAFFAELHRDVAAARSYVADVDGADRTVVLVGANVGAAAALQQAAARPEDVEALVLLSPGDSYLGMPGRDHARALRATAPDLPVLVVHSSLDETRGAALVVADLGAATSVLAVEPDPPDEDLEASHATRLLSSVPGLADRIADWIDRHVGGWQDLMLPDAICRVRVRRGPGDRLDLVLHWDGAGSFPGTVLVGSHDVLEEPTPRPVVTSTEGRRRSRHSVSAPDDTPLIVTLRLGDDGPSATLELPAR